MFYVSAVRAGKKFRGRLTIKYDLYTSTREIAVTVVKGNIILGACAPKYFRCMHVYKHAADLAT